MKHRTEGHTETTISGDTRADWSEAFELVPSLQIAYVWHASVFTREVLDGLLRIGFLYPQQIIWNKGRTVLTRTHYWYQHEPCWYVRKKNAPWFGKAGENSTIWDSPSPKFIMGGSDEEKFDHPTQKPVDLMRRPILNHTKRGELVYEPFLGQRHHAGGRGTDRARLLRHGARSEVRGRDRPALADAVRQEGHAGRRRADVRGDRRGTPDWRLMISVLKGVQQCALPWHGRGREFESHQVHQPKAKQYKDIRKYLVCFHIVEAVSEVHMESKSATRPLFSPG